MNEIEAAIQDKVRSLLEAEKIQFFIGYEKGSDPIHSAPCFVKEPKDVERLVWDPFCAHNLVTFIIDEKKRELPRGEEPDSRPIGLLVKGCDSKAMIQLMSENKIAREEVYIIGVCCNGVIDSTKLEKILTEKSIDFEALAESDIQVDKDSVVIKYKKEKVSIAKKRVLLDKCPDCMSPNTLVYDDLLGDSVEPADSRDYTSVEEIEALSLDKRWEFWKKLLTRCIRCSACRNICPICYCKECAVDSAHQVITPKTTYQEKANKGTWIEQTVDLPENLFFHLTRMLHMAGRCINCGECERVCPMNIPLSLLTRKLEKEVKELFGYEPGKDVDAKPLMSTFEEDDPGDFIK